jgi:predicted permease
MTHALRHLLRRPAISLVAIGALAIGIGSATAMFALVDGILVRPLPYRDARRLVQVWNTFPHWRGEPALDAMWDRMGLSWEDLQSVRTTARTIEGTGAAAFRSMQVDAGGRPEIRTVARGTASLLDVLGVRPALGRWFRPDEEGPGAPRIVVASWEYWSTRLGGDPAALGRDVEIEGDVFTLIGVLPRAFRFPAVMPPTAALGEPAVWQPVGTGRGDFSRNSQNYETIVRLRDDVPIAASEAELVPLLRAERSPEQRGGRLVPRLEAVAGAARTPLLLLFAATAALVLIACGNVALLLIGDARGRAAELSTKVALGASYARLLRERFVESAVLAIAGGALGAVLAYGIVRTVPAMLPLELPRSTEIAVDPRVLAFALALSIATGVLAGLAPALLSTNDAVASGSVRVTGRGTTRATLALVSCQIALSTVLLVAATLFGRSLVRLTAVDPGLDSDALLSVRVQLPRWKYDPTSATAFYQRALEEMRTIPGVQDAAVGTRLPLSGDGGSWAVAAEPDTSLTISSPVAFHEAVSPSFFAVMRIPIVEGRGFTAADAADAPRGALVNRTMAERLWPGRTSIGRAFRAPNGGRRTVVGVVADVRHHGLDAPPDATFYEPIAQQSSGGAVLLLRTAVPPITLAGRAREIVASLDESIPSPEIMAVREVLRATTADERFRTALSGMFGWIATVLAAIGLAGVMLRTVAVRRRELGIRIALGATPTGAARAAMRGAGLAVGVGLLIGVCAALALARLLASRLYGISPHDPASLVLAVAVLVTVAALALAAPAVRAAQVPAAEALRSD